MPQRRELRCSLSAANASFSITSRSQLPSAMSNFLQVNPAVPLLHREGNQAGIVAGAAHASAGIRLVYGAVSRAYQKQAGDIEKLPRLPVEFHGQVRAAVQIGVYAAVVADRERRLGLAAEFDLEAHALAGIEQVVARADQALRDSHCCSSPILSRH